MRRLTLVLVAGIALVATSLAVGAQRRDRSTAAVTATFTATTVGSRATSTCSNGDGVFQVTRATYTGTSTGDSSLAGPIRLMVRAAINTTKRLGTIDGNVVIDRAGRDTRAHLTAVYQDGDVSGLLFGQGLPPGQRFLGTFTGSYSADGGFGAGGIGVGNIDPAAIVLTEGSCTPAKPASGQLKLIGGSVLTLTDSSITVGLTAGGTFSCSIGDRAREEVSRQHIAVGDTVSAFCTFKSGEWTLLHVKKLNAPKPKDDHKKRR
jgi:hypothetical protein